MPILTGSQRISDGVRRLEEAVQALGFVGARSYPHWFGLPPDDRVYYPFYSKCVELGVPIQIQVGIAWQPRLRSVGRPDAIETVARDFPELRLVAIHTGYPWERELVAVARNHEIVFLGADTRDPRLWAPEILEFLQTDGRTRVLFGTDYPGGFLDLEDALNAVNELDIEPRAKEHLMCSNARGLYGLPDMSSGSVRQGGPNGERIQETL